MKLRKVVSLLVVFAMVLSFGIVASAATENKNVEIYYELGDDGFGYYTATIMMKMDEPGLDIHSVTEGRSTKFYGSGLYAFTFTINDADIYEEAPISSEIGDFFGNFKDNYYNATISFASVNKLVGSDGPLALCTLATNYAIADMTEEEVKAALGDLGYCTLQIATYDGVAGTTIVSDAYVTEYAVADGVVKHEEAEYVLITPENKIEEPEVTEVVPTEAVLTAVADAMIEKGQAVAMTFDAEDIKDYAGMNWKVDFASGTKYAKVDYPAATIAALDDATPVQFVAAFLVYDRGYEAVDEISGVAAGFCNADKELAGLTATVEVE